MIIAHFTNFIFMSYDFVLSSAFHLYAYSNMSRISDHIRLYLLYEFILEDQPLKP